jgi:hypothetical protein
VEHSFLRAGDTTTHSVDHPAPTPRSPLARQFGWFGVGAALALLLTLMRDMQAGPAPPGPVALWAADRDAQRVFGLDADLIVARRIAVDWPLQLEPTRDGGLWVLRSDDGHASSSSRLDRFDANGALVTELFLESCADLSLLDGDEALVLERVNNSIRLSRIRTEGSLFPLLDRPDLLCVSGSRASILLGTTTGTLLRVDAHTGAILAQLQLDGTIGDIAPGPTPGSAFALDTQGRLFLLDESLTIRWAAGVPYPSSHLGVVPDTERVYIADTSSPRVRRYGPSGVVELDVTLPTSGLDRTLALSHNGALLLTPGAILHLDENGTLAPGQGGFAWLADAARVR